jgi:hypothetical protein
MCDCERSGQNIKPGAATHQLGSRYWLNASGWWYNAQGEGENDAQMRSIQETRARQTS